MVKPAKIYRLGARQRRQMSDYYEDGFGMWNCPAFVGLGKRRDFTGETLRVFCVLIGHIEPKNRIRVPMEVVADDLGIQKSAVMRQVKKLVEAGVLIELKYEYELSPEYGFMGDPDKDLTRTPDGALALVR